VVTPRNYTRFFWLSDSTDPSSPLCVYHFKVVPFGATSSPFMLNAVLQYHLQQYNTPVSMICSLISTWTTGCEKEQAAVDYYRQARTIMGEARFNLCSWSSNSTKLTAIANKENTAKRATTVNVLRLRWNPTSDEFHLSEKSSILVHEHLITK